MNENNQTNTESTNNKSKITRSLTDGNLYILCKRYGERALKWRRKFAGLLPEVNKRRLYEKKGFLSIYHFAAKLSGISKEQVKRILSLNEKFEDKPILKKMLIEGKESVNKLARIASIATMENQEFLAKQVELLPQSALETLVRDIKTESQNGLFESKTHSGKFVRAHKLETSNVSLNLSEEVVGKLAELQNKGININELILEFLNKRELEISETKIRIAKEIKMKNYVEARKEQLSINPPKVTVTRYIPVQIKKIIHQEHGTKCSIPNCQKLATNLHHTQRFSLSKNHDPHFIAPLCHEHHLIAHTIDLNFHKNRR